MIRSALLLCAALLAAGCVYQAASTPPPARAPLYKPLVPPAPASLYKPLMDLTSISPCDAPTFVASVKVLNASYTPKVPQGQYSPPYGQVDDNATTNLRSEIKNDLSDAFTNAPPFFKTRLCSLDGIYISPRGCTGDVNNCNIASGEDVFLNSWGFRDWISSGADNGKKYIAISAGLWPNDGTGHSHALLFSQSQEVLLQRLITWSEPHPHVAGTGTDPDTSWMTILASLAHEFGHIHWVATTIRNPGDTTSDFSRLNLCGFFNYWQYNNPKQLQPPNRWRAFRNRDTSNGVPIDHRYLPTNDDFDDATLTSDEKNDLFFLLYEPNKPWPSYFGALTPDEQFVETYVFHVLVGNQLDYATTPYLKSLPVLISYTDGSTHVVDIPNDFWSGTGKPALYSKMACIPS